MWRVGRRTWRMTWQASCTQPYRRSVRVVIQQRDFSEVRVERKSDQIRSNQITNAAAKRAAACCALVAKT
jgi:hypothetical protein